MPRELGYGRRRGHRVQVLYDEGGGWAVGRDVQSGEEVAVVAIISGWVAVAVDLLGGLAWPRAAGLHAPIPRWRGRLLLLTNSLGLKESKKVGFITKRTKLFYL